MTNGTESFGVKTLRLTSHILSSCLLSVGDIRSIDEATLRSYEGKPLLLARELDGHDSVIYRIIPGGYGEDNSLLAAIRAANACCQMNPEFAKARWIAYQNVEK